MDQLKKNGDKTKYKKYSSSKTFPVNMHHCYIYPMVARELMAVCAHKIYWRCVYSVVIVPDK